MIGVGLKLPPEIWLDVFRYSVESIGSSLIYHTSPSPIDNAPHTRLFNKLHAPALRQKWSLLTVCHAWFGVAITIFYETIVLKSPIEGLLLSQALSSIPYEPGRFTKRLIWDCTIVPPTSIDPHILAKVLSYCPNVISLLYRDQHIGTPLSASIFLHAPFSAQLEVFSYLAADGSYTSMDAFELYNILSFLPNLRYLHLDRVIVLRPNDRHDRSLFFPHLVTLRFEGIAHLEHVAKTWHSPSLTHLVGVGNFTSWPEWLRAPHIKSLTYTDPFESPAIIEACPEVTDACFMFSGVLWARNTTPFVRLSLETDGLDHLLNVFVSVNNPVSYPCLATVRVLEFRSSTNSNANSSLTRKEWSFWNHWIARWKSRGVRLENASGALMVIPENDIFSATAAQDYHTYWDPNGISNDGDNLLEDVMWSDDDFHASQDDDNDDDDDDNDNEEAEDDGEGSGESFGMPHV